MRDDRCREEEEGHGGYNASELKGKEKEVGGITKVENSLVAIGVKERRRKRRREIKKRIRRRKREGRRCRCGTLVKVFLIGCEGKRVCALTLEAANMNRKKL